MTKITVTPGTDCATVAFPYDRDLVASLKTEFPKARWDTGRKAWAIPGKTAAKRAEKWIAARKAAEPTADDAQRARDDLAFNPIESRRVGIDFSGLTVRTPYSEAIVALLRGIKGSSFDRGAPNNKDGFWRVPVTSADALRAVLPEIERLSGEIEAADRAKAKARGARRAAQQAEWDRERQERQAAKTERVSRRYMELLSAAPPVGAVIRLRGEAIKVESLGKPWRLSDDDADMCGLLGHEGERVCYVYWREATEAEEADLTAREVAAARAAAERAEAKAALRVLEDTARGQGEQPGGANVLDGEILLESDARLRLYGGGSWWVAAEDGLWFVRNNGMDGDDWSRNNVRTGGAGAIGWRLPRDPAMEAELRRIAAALKGG